MTIERPDAVVAQFAAANDGVFPRSVALRAGLSPRQITHRLATNVWSTEHPGVYRHNAVARTERSRRRAALFWAGPDAVLSHRSAAALWALGLDDDRVEVSFLGGQHRRTGGVISHRTSTLTPTDARIRDGMRVTSPVRTIIDLATTLDPPSLEAVVESARRQRLVTVGAIRRRVDGLAAPVELRRLLVALEGTAPAESPLEVMVARRLRDEPVPTPIRQHVVVLFGRKYRLDFAWPGIRLALECNGEAYHDFQHDNERWRHLGASGWRVLPVTWRDVTRDWQGIANELQGAFSRAASGW
jgi:very-short-patch-repair endonuclease